MHRSNVLQLLTQGQDCQLCSKSFVVRAVVFGGALAGACPEPAFRRCRRIVVGVPMKAGIGGDQVGSEENRYVCR